MLSKRIESLRRKKGLSQLELAKLLHVSPSAVGMYAVLSLPPAPDSL